MKNCSNILIPLVIIAFIFSGCARENPWPTIDSDLDNIYDDEEILNNQNTCDIICPKGDGTYVCKDCVTSADCNCNGVPDDQEPETTKNCKGFECIPGWVKWSVGIAGGLTAGYFALEKVNWFQGYGPDVQVKAIDWEASYLKFSEGRMEIYVIGTCTNSEGKDDPCEFELTSNLFSPRGGDEWTNFSPSTKANYLKYYFTIGSEDNHIKVRGTDPITKEKKEYILPTSSWLQISTTPEKLNETFAAVGAFNGDGPQQLFLADKPPYACFITTKPVGVDKTYIFTEWKRIACP